MKPFLQGRKTSSREPLRLQRASGSALPCVRPTTAHAASTQIAGPTVEVVKEGDKVVRLVVTCACGERVEVECLYPAGA